MQSFNLTSYALALILLLSAIFTVSWGVQRLLSNLTESVAQKPAKVKIGL